MVVLGPVLFGFILGIVIGSQIKSTPQYTVKLTKASYAIIVVCGIIIAWCLGQYPFYNDLPVATGFLSTLIGLLIGKVLFAGSRI